MIGEILLGTFGVLGMASGIGALVFWKKNGNGKHGPVVSAEPLTEADIRRGQELFRAHPEYGPAPVQVQWPPGLEEALAKAASPVLVESRPAWPEIVGELERITQRVLVAARQPPEPEWATKWASRIESDLAESDKRLARLASDLSENMTNDMARFYAGVSKDLKQPDVQPVLSALAGEMTKLADLPGKISRGVAEALIAERKKNPPSPPPEKGKGGNPSPPRAAPPNLPRMDPNELPATPSIPAPYVPGTVEVPAGQVWSLLYLIQKQLSPNCPGTSAEFSLSAGDGTVFVGGATSIGGKLSETNYAYKLEDGDPPRIYRSSFPGNNTPVGEIQVLSTGGGSLHVEVQS